MRTEAEMNQIICTYGDLIFKLALSYVKDYATAEDILQTVFLKYMLQEKVFEELQHEKAWLIRVTINECKMHYRLYWNSRRDPLLESMQVENMQDDLGNDVTLAVMKLPVKYRVVVHLHYYEEYSVKEIAEILGKKENTVLSLLFRARKKLKKELENYYEG